VFSFSRATFVVTFAISVAAARADLVPTPLFDEPTFTPANTRLLSYKTPAWIDCRPLSALGEIPKHTTFQHEPIANTNTLGVQTVPPPPPSSALCLWTLGGLGLWQLSRNTRKFHGHARPDWYAARSPQVGRTLPFDLITGFSHQAQPISLWHKPITETDPSPILDSLNAQYRLQLFLRDFLVDIDPRSPPKI
jgi:hypothetical protein